MVSRKKKRKKERGIFQAGGMEMKQQEGRRQKKLCTAAKANNSKQGRPWTDTFSRGPPDFRWCCCCLGRRTGEIINPNTKRNSNLRRGWNSKKGKEIPFFLLIHKHRKELNWGGRTSVRAHREQWLQAERRGRRQGRRPGRGRGTYRQVADGSPAAGLDEPSQVRGRLRSVLDLVVVKTEKDLGKRLLGATKSWVAPRSGAAGR